MFLKYIFYSFYFQGESLNFRATFSLKPQLFAVVLQPWVLGAMPFPMESCCPMVWRAAEDRRRRAAVVAAAATAAGPRRRLEALQAQLSEEALSVEELGALQAQLYKEVLSVEELRRRLDVLLED